MNKFFLPKFLIFCILFSSCLYKAGNRSYDINQRYNVSLSPFYIKKFLKELDPLYANDMLITSEIVNYPENFIPVTDSLNGYKFVIEFHSLDSINYLESPYLNLASIYDFKKLKWIKERDSLKNKELEKFEIFFRDCVLNKVIKKYYGIVNDSFLFVDKSHAIWIKKW